MTTTLSEGVKVPDVGSTNWAGDLEVNWNLLNGALANLSGNVKLDRDNTWTGEQSFTLPIVGSITGTASKAIADEDGTSIKTGYVNVAGNQTVTGNKEFTGSNTFNNILPNATNTYSLGSSSYQWSSVYAQSYYYNGTEFQNKFVTTDTDQTLVGRKNFKTSYSDILPKTATLPSSTRYYVAQRDYAYNDESLTLTWGFVQASGMNVRRWYVYPYSSGDSVYFQINISADASSSEFKTNVKSVIPVTNNATDLGTSTNKWKTLNGINPGALSLPDFTSETGVSLSAGANTYTPTFSGWLSISTTGDISVVCGNFCHKATDMISVPVIAGKTYTVTMPASATGYFYSCLGNV